MRTPGSTYARRFLPFCAISGLGAVSPAVATLTLTKQVDPSLGTVYSGSSGRQFIVNTSGSVSGSGSGDYLSGAAAAVFQVGDDSSPSAITILADSITTTGGLTLNRVLCSYNGGTQQRCDASGGITATSAATATLRVGFDVSTSVAHSGGDTASVSMDISVAYQ